MPKDKLVLKPFLSIPPRIYVAVLWGIALSVMLYFLLFSHGLRNQGSFLKITSIPPRASIFIDGTFFGSDADTNFLPSGSYMLEARKTGYKPITMPITSSSRVFATLFVPSRKRMTLRFELENETAIIAALVNQVSLSSTIGNNPVFIGEPNIQLAIEEALVLDNEALIIDLIVALAPFLSGVHHHNDFEQALELLKERSPALLDTIGEALRTRYPYIHRAAEELPPSFVSLVTGTPSPSTSIVEQTQYFYTEIQNRSDASGRRLLVAGIPFRFIRGGTSYLVQDTELVYPQRFELPDFYIMENELTAAFFAEFLASDFYAALSVPEKESFFDVSSITELADDEPLSFVNLHGARLVAAYLNHKLIDSPLGQEWTIRLPYSQEWEYAAYIDDSFNYLSWEANSPLPSSGRIGLDAMFGGVWEWVETPYIPLHGYVDASFLSAVDLQEVRGASWIQNKEDIGPTIRGIQDANWKTPYLGFRFVMVPRNQ